MEKQEKLSMKKISEIIDINYNSLRMACILGKLNFAIAFKSDEENTRYNYQIDEARFWEIYNSNGKLSYFKY